MSLIHNTSFIVRTQEIDQHKHLSPPALIMLMQEASMEHVVKIKASYWDLAPLKLSWVLLRKEVKINRLPLLGETIQVQTYPTGFDRIFAYRDYIVRSAKGKIMATAGSTWTLIHMETRKTTRIPDDLLHFAVKEGVGALKHPPNRIPLPDREDAIFNHRVQWYDLDWNGHVNNVFLARCLMESVPDEYLETRELHEFTIHFKAESFWKDQLKVSFQKMDKTQTLAKIVRLSDGNIVAHSISRWK